MIIVIAGLLRMSNSAVGFIGIIPDTVARAAALGAHAINLVVGTAAVVNLKDSWRVGALEKQRTDLSQSGIFRFSRNSYFLSYLIMFAAYTVLLQHVILSILSLAGFAMIHKMVLKEEQYLLSLHGKSYVRYKEKVPRYLFV
jgi:protein-S-isoprenylcysteine O-methyltransferase Ste14